MYRGTLCGLILLLGCPPAAESSVVYLFRHCIRSCDTSGLQAYASQPWAPWNVPLDYCLPRGLEIVKGVGMHLRTAATPVVSNPTIIADNVQRNIDSATALAEGGGWAAPTIDGTPFTRCASPSKDEKTKLIKERYAEVPPPLNRTAMIAAIDRILNGTEKRISDQPDEGKSALAASAAEFLLMQVGGGMEVGWGKVNPADVYSLLQMQAYNWQVTRRALKIEQAK
eukprot:gene20135-22750_t